MKLGLKLRVFGGKVRLSLCPDAAAAALLSAIAGLVVEFSVSSLVLFAFSPKLLGMSPYKTLLVPVDIEILKHKIST